MSVARYAIFFEMAKEIKGKVLLCDNFLKHLAMLGKSTIFAN